MDHKVTANPIKTYNFIRDKVATIDSFGSHERVAKAIARVIQSDPFLRVVGLIGPWGSGKSTALQLIQNQMKVFDEETKTKTYFFVYDAWQHQSDPPRRSFLEMLVRFLVVEKLTEEADWTLDLDRLNRQVEDNETTVTPTLTFSGKVLLVALALVPLGFLFSGHDWLNETVAVGPLGWHWNVFRMGLWLIATPIFAAVFVYLYLRATQNPLKRGFYTFENWTKSRLEGASILSIFMNREVTRSHHRVIRTPDPTSIEFQKQFRKIMLSVFDPARKFVFIVDNLDRLSGKEAIALWATVRSFFLGAADDSSAVQRLYLPTVLLPIDPSALERQYSETGQSDPSTLSRSFMDKTFDLTFFINRPVPSDWVAYLGEKMHAVFAEECTDEWIYVVRRLYDAFVASTGEVVTPRKINALVNSIALLRTQWLDEIPFPTQAFYAINRERISENVIAVISEPQRFLAERDARWPEGVGGIYYGVSRDKALQVILRTPLVASINDVDQVRFDELTKIPGAEMALEEAIEFGARPEDSDPQFVTKASVLIKAKDFPESATLLSLWATLRHRFNNTQSWNEFPPYVGSGINALIATCPDGDLAEFCDKVGAKLSNINSATLPKGTPSETWPSMALAAFDAGAKRATTVRGL